MSQSLSIPNLSIQVQGKDIQAISPIMDGLKKHPLSKTPWRAFPYSPKVDFSIAHSGDYVYLKYFVAEKHLRAVNTEINSPVYEDSCVEFFISFDDTGYYNFECNSLGTFLVYFGKDLATRKPLSTETIEKIQTFTTFQRNVNDKSVNWTITWAIPISTFSNHLDLSLKGKASRANFYKCGDKLPEPHYISWSNITTEKPDFHRPEFFGEVVFE